MWDIRSVASLPVALCMCIVTVACAVIARHGQAGCSQSQWEEVTQASQALSFRYAAATASVTLPGLAVCHMQLIQYISGTGQLFEGVAWPSLRRALVTQFQWVRLDRRQHCLSASACTDLG